MLLAAVFAAAILMPIAYAATLFSLSPATEASQR